MGEKMRKEAKGKKGLWVACLGWKFASGGLDLGSWEKVGWKVAFRGGLGRWYFHAECY